MQIRKELTKTPRTKPDVNSLGFGKYFTDHMFIMQYKEGKGWFDPAIVPYAPISIEPSAMVFHYGQAVFEGLKAYKTVNGEVVLFRADQNFKRLNNSDNRMCIPEVDADFAIEALKELIKVDIDWIPEEPGTSLYVRPFIIATEPMLGVRASEDYLFMIILSPVGSYYPQGINPIDIFIEDDYVRAVRGGIGFTKSSANYAISLKAQVKAKELGYTQVLWLDGVEKKYIEEVGTTNVFFKIGGKLVTPELNGSILPGVTRDSVIKLVRSWGVEVEERKISIDEIYEAHKNGTLEEAFATGTAAVVSPIGSFLWKENSIVINDKKIGEFSQKLYDEITSIQYGKAEDKFGWVIKVQ